MIYYSIPNIVLYDYSLLIIIIYHWQDLLKNFIMLIDNPKRLLIYESVLNKLKYRFSL